MESRIVSFSCAGCRMYGTLHTSRARLPGTAGVILLNQGPLDRSGAHRLSVKLARCWTAAGLTVLRFDARGAGESEGAWSDPPEGAPIRLLYKNVDEGAWAPDAHAAVDFLQSETPVRRVLLAGLCGGASTALHAGATNPVVRAVAMVGLPVRVQSDIKGVRDLVDSHVRTEAHRYFERALTPAAWKRFVARQTDYRTLLAVMAKRAELWYGRGPSQHPSLNAGLMDRLRAALKARKRLLFVYPENDYLWTEFRELLLPHFQSASDRFTVETIAHANHTFTEMSGQQDLCRVLTTWSLAELERSGDP
jgi:dienelactone hydrolase